MCGGLERSGGYLMFQCWLIPSCQVAEWWASNMQRIFNKHLPCSGSSARSGGEQEEDVVHAFM